MKCGKGVFPVLMVLALVLAAGAASAAKLSLEVPESLQKSRLFVTLPKEYVSTPDGMAIHKSGDLVVACPNFGDQSLPGVIIRIDAQGNVSKWFEVPVNKNSGVARPMGIDFDKDGNLYIVDNQGWTGNPESVNQGRILKVSFDGDAVAEITEIAVGMEHPNGIKIRDGYAYVTQSSLSNVKDPSGLLVSCVYRFPVDAKDIRVYNTLDDKNIIATFITRNPDVQYGLDGLVFDAAGSLYVGNFGDGAVHKLTFNADGSVKDNAVWAKDPENLFTTDGMCIDEKGNIYVADFSPNAIVKIDPSGKIGRIAQSPDSTGAKGELDQPGEPIVWNGKLVVTCFDMVTDDGKVNSAHDDPQTIVELDLN
ncbi:MAG: SMP-30/gluconolactonase/LRE family protein [Synergistaceae bacterium]|jgi:sugar lactone lactonase YvrE|nr:SMP-30/gluconolactonase/LRE family protein [Synergistaceae bacterium]